MSLRTDALKRQADLVSDLIASQRWDALEGAMNGYRTLREAIMGPIDPTEQAAIDRQDARIWQMYSLAKGRESYAATNTWALPWNVGAVLEQAGAATEEAKKAAAKAQALATLAKVPTLAKTAASQQTELDREYAQTRATAQDAAWYNQTVFGVPTWAWMGLGVVGLVMVARR